MATHPCPACTADAFTWSVDENSSPNTQWHCSVCGFEVSEDESKRDWCSRCGRDSAIHLLAKPGPGLWCLRCRATTTAGPGPDEIAARLGYDGEWFAAGIVDAALLRAQWATWLEGVDQNAEHYRNGAFRRHLDSHDELSDEAVRTLLALRCHGPDGRDLSSVRLTDLLRWPGLTDGQIDNLLDWSGKASDAARRLQLRAKVTRRLADEGLSDAAWNEIVDSGDAQLHELVLSHEDARRSHLDWLAVNGANRRVRNLADQARRQARP